MAHVHSGHVVSGFNKKALLIAIKDTTVEGFPKLYHPQYDARQLRRLLIEVYGYPMDNITLMMDHKSTPEALLPTKKNIKKQMQLFVRDASTEDHLFFYYSGHGNQVPCEHHTEPDGLDELICTCDGKEIMDNTLKKCLVNPLPPGCKLFALFDACHSHTILDLDHHECNEPGGRRRVHRGRESSSPSLFWQVFPRRFWKKGVPPLPKSALTIAYELRGRTASRAPISITAISAGSSPLSKWSPFSMEDIQRVLSPRSYFACNGKCPLPTECDMKRAHVICLSACKDDEIAVDDNKNGTVTKFFVDYLKERPKPTLRELLLAIRERVDEITAARQKCDAPPGVISRPTTFAGSPRVKVKTEWTPVRRNTEVNVGTLEEFLRYTTSSVQEEEGGRYSQQPSYSSHYPLNLDELVDL